MNLIGELENAHNYAAKRGPQCTVCRYYLTLTGEEQQALDAAFASNLMSTSITRALNNAGNHFGTNTVNRHRKGECRGVA